MKKMNQVEKLNGLGYWVHVRNGPDISARMTLTRIKCPAEVANNQAPGILAVG